MNQPIYIASSPWFIFVASILYFSVVVSLLLLPWFLWLKIGCLIFLLLDYKRVIYQHGLRRHKYAVAIICQDCDKWHYQMHSGRQYKGRLVKNRSFCSSLLLVLCIQHMNDGVRYVFIPRDALSKHNFRFLAYILVAI